MMTMTTSSTWTKLVALLAHTATTTTTMESGTAPIPTTTTMASPTGSRPTMATTSQVSLTTTMTEFMTWMTTMTTMTASSISLNLEPNWWNRKIVECVQTPVLLKYGKSDFIGGSPPVESPLLSFIQNSSNSDTQIRT